MPGKDDFYQVLGVSRKASADEISKAYKRLARKYHPDLNPSDKSAEERFKKISEANDVLGDPKKRQVYDRMGYYSSAEAQAGQGAHSGQRPVDFSGFDFSEFAGPRGASGGTGGGPGAGGFRDVFSQFFNKGEPEIDQPTHGSDLEYHVNVAFWDAIRGTTVRLNVIRQKSCPTCHGRGSLGGQSTCSECKGSGTAVTAMGNMRFNVTCARCKGKGITHTPCTTCGGEGRLSEPESMEVRIPAGAQDGFRLRVAGKGNAGAHGGPRGDLYIVTKVAHHEFFERKGDDIHTIVPITITEATLGAKVEVPAIDGSRALVKIPPGTSSGQKFRLREKGVKSLKTGEHGDQYVVVRVQVPKIADERSKEILRELAQLNPQNPREELYRNI